MSYRTILLSTVAVCLALEVAPSAAQGQKIEEVTVTARKRPESILKVPVIEAVITEKTLNQFGAHDLKSLQAQTPSLAIGSNLGDFGSQIAIRGIGNVTLNATVDQAVSLNIDGLQMTQGLAYSTGMFDVAQVEVLEGPQALFYGKSTTGGVISLRSNDPTDETDVILRDSYEFEAAERESELILSGPVTDTLKLRLAAKYTDQDGFFKNTAVGIPALGGITPPYKNFAPQKELILRGTALWNPTDRLSVRLKANYDWFHLNGDDYQEQYASCPTGTADPYGIPFMSPTENCKIDRNIQIVWANPALYPGIRNGGQPFHYQWQAFGTLDLNYRLTDNLTATSVTGYDKLSQQDDFNGTDTEMAGSLFWFDNNFSVRDVSEELRLSSDYSGPWNFMAGGYYHDGQDVQGLTGRFNQLLTAPLLYFQQGSFTIDTKAFSLFGQVRYKLFRDLELSAGARWGREEKTLSEVSTYPRFDSNGNEIVGIGPIATGVPKIVSYHLNPEVTLTYTPTDNLTFFGSYKEASKSGGFQTTILQPAGTDLSFKDEGVKGGEGGVKAYLLDGRASVNLSAYKYDYSNLQVGENLDTPEGLQVFTTNAASANIWGIEFQGSYIPEMVDGLTLQAGVNYNHARFGSFPNAVCWGGQTIGQGCDLAYSADANGGLGGYTAQSLAGRPLLKAPELSATFGFDYERPVWNDMMLSIASSTQFSGRYYTDLAERSDMTQNAYFKTNLSITLTGPNDAWEFAVIGNNLNDEITTGYCANSLFTTGDLNQAAYPQLTGATTSGPLGPDAVVCNVDRGREVWLRLTLRPLDLIH